MPWPERAWRWSRKRPLRAMLRGAAGLLLLSWAAVPLGFARLSGLAMVTVFLVLLAAVLRARPKPLLLGSLVSVLVLGPVALIGLGIAAEYRLGGQASPSDAGDMAFVVAGAALALGIAVGALYTERWRALAAGLLALAVSGGVMGLEGTHPGLLSAAVGSAYVGLVTRLARWRWPGDPIDTAVGCLMGWLAGFLIGAVLIGCVSALRGFPGVGPEPDAMMVAMGAALVGLGLAGGVGGGALMAMATRPARGVAPA
jgi:hypothetical protein